jgi:hypothetical protein
VRQLYPNCPRSPTEIDVVIGDKYANTHAFVPRSSFFELPCRQEAYQSDQGGLGRYMDDRGDQRIE